MAQTFVHVALLCLLGFPDVDAAVNIRGSWIDTHHLQAAEIGAATAHHRVRASVDWVKVAWIAGITLVVAAVIGGIVVVVMKKKQAAEAEEEAATGVPHANKKVDYKALLTGLSKRITEEVGPKFSKDGACRLVLEKRFEDFQDKAKNFLLSEMNKTAGSVMNELEAEESLMMLEWNNAIESNFPPVSILVAGIFSPTIVDFMSFHHLLQFLTVALPLFLMCVWAIYTDLIAVRQPCDAIPSLYAWLYTQTVITAMLFVGHGCLLAKLRSGKARIQAKKEEVEYELKGKEEGGFANMREQFIGRTVILQEALMTENGVRHSSLNTIVGVATIVWLITTTWNLVLVVGWTFVPGVVAFHPKAAAVSGDDYCGAWATVFVLKVSMLLSVLYFFGNLYCVVQFLCDSMINSKGFSDAVLSQARDIDKNGPGVPVTEVLFKAFLLRGGDEALISRLAVATHHTRSLQHKKAELEGKISALNFKISAASQEEDSLTSKSKEEGGGDLAAQCKKLNSEAVDYDNWKRQGRIAIDDTEKDITAVGAASTEALEKLYTKVDSTLKEIENSDAVQAAIAAAKDAEKQIEARMNEAYTMLNDPEFQAKVKEIAEQAKAQCEQLGTQAEELAKEALATAQDPEFQKKLHDPLSRQWKKPGPKLTNSLQKPSTILSCERSLKMLSTRPRPKPRKPLLPCRTPCCGKGSRRRRVRHWIRSSRVQKAPQQLCLTLKLRRSLRLPPRKPWKRPRKPPRLQRTILSSRQPRRRS
jgi:hypothetical protein